MNVHSLPLGRWAVSDDAGVAFQAFRFSTGLFASSASTSSGSLELEVLLFDRNTSVVYAPPATNGSSNATAGGGGGSSKYTFTVDQSLAKLSLSVTGWPWRDDGSRLRVKLALNPQFSEVVMRPGTPQANMTTLELQGQGGASANVTTVVRLVDFAYVDGGNQTVEVQFWANATDSSLTLEFPYFASSLYYDPGTLLASVSKSTHDTRHTTHDTRHTTHDTRHTTHDTRHTTHDTHNTHADWRWEQIWGCSCRARTKKVEAETQTWR
jgi:hypothetical protein